MNQSRTRSTGSLEAQVDGLSTSEPSTGLVILWAADEPERVGEVLLIPPGALGRSWLLGRGQGDEEDPHERLEPLRQRPGDAAFTGPLRSGRISRCQLVIEEVAPGTLRIRNMGRRRLLHQGKSVEQAEVVQGEVIEVEQQLLLLCTRRPAILPALPKSVETPGAGFGMPDAHGIVGESPAIWELRRQLAVAAAQDTHVLIRGPSGAGKELAARAVHSLSSRRRKPLVARNAATFPETLIDAELFGQARDYPNKGSPERPGLIGEADGSFLFLDEIGELPVALQTRLLRVLDQGEYQRLGESQSRKADFRLLGATNRPLEVLRHDVLARFQVHVQLPGLDERPEDIPLLANHLLRRMAKGQPEFAQRFFPEAHGKECPRLSLALMSALVMHPYKTHIRELEYLLRKCMGESSGAVVGLSADLREKRSEHPRGETHAQGSQAAHAPVKQAAEIRSAPNREEMERLIFTEEERQALAVQRRHLFNMTACGRDPQYPGVRQTAERHIRVLLSKALIALDWQVQPAVALVAGVEWGGPFATLNDKACTRVRSKLERFLEGLQKQLSGDPVSEEGLQASLRESYGVNAIQILQVVGALRKGRLRSSTSSGD